MIHSGSRNLGKRVADYYNKVAVEINERYFSSIPRQWELAFLPIETDEAKQYFNEMKYCVEFAFANRKLMMDNIKKIFIGTLKNITFDNKGATRAYEEEVGIIPGSMGTKSYIVQGLGNPESFKSCSHGAGRMMGRREAQRTLNLENEIDIMNSQGIIHDITSIDQLDEAPNAYKDINLVMENQKDLVKILVELKPLAVIKG